MIKWFLHNLAEQMGAAPARAGEEIHPQIRLEHDLPQWLFFFIILGSAALIIWLYWHEGRASRASKMLLASVRIALVLLALFMLSEAVLSVERKGLPYLTILVDDSASGRIADQYEKPEEQAALDALAVPAQADQTTRLAIAKGLIMKNDARLIRDLEKEHNVRLYRVSNSAELLAEVDRPSDVRGALEKLRGVQASGSQSRLGDAVRRILTELRGAPPSAIVLLSDGQTTEGEPLSKAAELAKNKGVPLYAIGLGSAERARDIELTELLVDDVVFVDDAVRFQVKLSSRASRARKSSCVSRSSSPGRKTRPPLARSSPRKSSCRPTASPFASSWSIIPRPPASAASSSRWTNARASFRSTIIGSSA